MQNKPSWQSSQFGEQETDPLSGFANIMDVMLVFALGLMLSIIAKSPDLQEKFKIKPNKKMVEVSTGKELPEKPDAIERALTNEEKGMEALGQVYRDPKTGKLIMIKQSKNK